MNKIKIKKSEFQKLYSIACESWQSKFNTKFTSFTFVDYIEFDESFLSEIESACDNKQRIVFNKIFKSHLKDKIDLFKIDSYSKVCKVLKQKEITINDFSEKLSFLSQKQLMFLVGCGRAKQLEQLFNQGWIPDFTNRYQYKYNPYFIKNTDGWFFFWLAWLAWAFLWCGWPIQR